MALSFFSKKNRIVTIIINDHFIRYVELKQTNPPVVAKWGERLLPNGMMSNGKIYDYDNLVLILAQCVDEWKLRNRKVRFLIPESFVIIRKVSIPAEIKDDEVKGYLYLELGTTIHLPFEEPVFDAVVLAEENNKKEVLIFAAPEENVLEYRQLFLDVKLDPVEAEISPLALYRLYSQLDQAQAEEHLLVVQFEIHAVTICIFDQQFPIFMHYLPIEFDAEQWQITYNRMHGNRLTFIGKEEELLAQFGDIYKEINRLMDFYRYSLHQGQQQVSKILIDGEHPMLAAIVTEMKHRFEIPLEMIAYPDTIKEDPLPSTYYLAVGLALKGG